MGMAADAQRLATLMAGAAERVRDLESELDDLEASTAESPDDEHDPEGATIGFERARVTGLLERARAELDALHRAADRAEGGAYGRCAVCGQPIPAERLEALPATERCVTCAAATDRPPGAAGSA